jgi:hypothetical protein
MKKKGDLRCLEGKIRNLDSDSKKSGTVTECFLIECRTYVSVVAFGRKWRLKPICGK